MRTMCRCARPERRAESPSASACGAAGARDRAEPGGREGRRPRLRRFRTRAGRRAEREAAAALAAGRGPAPGPVGARPVGRPSGRLETSARRLQRLRRWSPHGLYVAVADGREFVAVDPGGTVQWTHPAPGRVYTARVVRVLRRPTARYQRIAYLSGNDLRVIDANGTDDRPRRSRCRLRTAPAGDRRTQLRPDYVARRTTCAVNVDA